MQITLTKCFSLVTQLQQGRTDYTPSELSDYANLALVDITTSIEMRSLQSHAVSSTTSGGSWLTFPTGAHYVTSISNLSLVATDSRKTLVPTTLVDLDSRSTEVGVPERFALSRDSLLFWPSADSAYSFQIRFQERVDTVVSSTSTPNIDERYHYPWVLRTAAIAAAMRNDVDGEQIAQARYLGEIGKMPSDAALAQQAKPARISLNWRSR